MNAQITDDTALGRLMHDMWCVEAEDMHYGVLAERVRYFKENEEGVATMCRAMEEMVKDAAFRTKVEIMMMTMKKLGWTKEQALEFYEIPESEHARYIAAL